MSEWDARDQALQAARERVHTDKEVVLSAQRWVVENFGGDYDRAAAFFDQLARWR